MKRELLARVLSVDANGQVQVLFTENIIPKDTKDLKIVDEALVVTVMKFDEETQEYSIPVGFAWTCTKFKDRGMDIKLTFDSPASVSTTNHLDKVFVHFKNEMTFMTLKDFINIEPDYKISGEIP